MKRHWDILKVIKHAELIGLSNSEDGKVSNFYEAKKWHIAKPPKINSVGLYSKGLFSIDVKNAKEGNN